MIILLLILLGLMLGSFAGAQVWRLRARQLIEDKAAGEPVDAAELKRLTPLTKATFKTDRSRCLMCQHELAWYDLIPLISWCSTAGRCRYCRQAIGWFEPAIELGTAAFFVVSYLLWPVELGALLPTAQFVCWLLAGVGLAILAGYDAKWSLLPNIVMFPTIAMSAIVAAIAIYTAPDALAATWSALGAVGILAGLYLLVYIASRGRWIGFGDVKLGIALGLLLADWQLALLALFAANLIGTLIVLPGMISGKLSRNARIPFGPLLIAGFLVAAWWGAPIIAWYTSLFFTF